MAVASDMVARVEDLDLMAGLRQFPADDRAGQAGADNAYSPARSHSRPQYREAFRKDVKAGYAAIELRIS
jgi:hypothetical protein